MPNIKVIGTPKEVAIAATSQLDGCLVEILFSKTILYMQNGLNNQRRDQTYNEIKQLSSAEQLNIVLHRLCIVLYIMILSEFIGRAGLITRPFFCPRSCRILRTRSDLFSVVSNGISKRMGSHLKGLLAKQGIRRVVD